MVIVYVQLSIIPDIIVFKVLCNLLHVVACIVLEITSVVICRVITVSY